ncbi:unnamed protein product [Ectocarpus sp. CCAP 1310/34]|nr:unnamed protein product [Ectocarpus sp. CCAP 1310/34]
MPDMDTPQISGIFEERAPPPAAGGGGVVGVQQASKRPRDEGSPVRGKRGRGANGDISLSLKISVPATSSSPLVPSSSLPASPLWVPPLCESPSKINQAPSPFASYSSGAAAAKPPALAADDAAAPVAGPAAAAVASVTSRRKGRMPHAAPPSLGATDPIFHAALLRLLHRRNGDHCAEAVGWRWRGDTPARFDHWPCALHPSVMDLLACVSASEEQVVLTGCDKKHAESCNGGGDDPPPPRREAAWRAPRPRTPWAHRGRPAAAAAGVTTPIAAPSPLPPPASAQTPLSALRRSGSSRRLPSKNRVRFSTHDMSVVDTPDPQRGGSAKGMMSALGGLESILSAAERIRELAAGGPGNSGGRERGGLERRGGDDGRQYEGYFDRFSAAAGGEPDGSGGGRGGGDDNNEQEGTAAAAGGLDKASSGSDGGSQDEGSAAAAEGDDDEDFDAPLETEAKSVREDSAAFVTVLEEIANGDAAPGEVALAGGWGPEHRNAAAFYAEELAFLCGTKTGVSGREVGGRFVSGGGGAVGSHLRVRYLDVLSCLVRYNLKLLLNTCECETPDEQQQELDIMDDGDDQEDEEEHDAQQPQQAEDTHGDGEGDGDDDDDDVSDDENDDDSVPTANLPSPPSPTAAALSVIVPGRAALLRQQGLLDAAWGSSVTAQAATAERGLCGCVSVLDDKGALEFNTEDVAALLTLALGRVHPFMPLAARITVAAKEAGWDGCGDDGDEALDARVWAAVQEYTLEGRRAAAAEAAASPTHLFSSPSVAAATPPLLPVAVCGGGSSAAEAGGPSAGGAADKLPSSGFAVKGGEGEAKADAGSDGARASVADLASPSVPGSRGSVSEENGSAAGLELTVDESADLLEFVAAARFIAQLLAEPVVAAGVAGGRWSCAMRLSEQVRKLAEEEQQAQEAVAAAAKTAPPTSSLSNMLCLGALADVQGLGLAMAQQARYAPALEAALKRELRQALRGGQGLKRRIKHRLQLPGAPDVFSFPMITPACQLIHYEGVVGCV